METISRAPAGNRCAHINLYNNNERITRRDAAQKIKTIDQFRQGAKNLDFPESDKPSTICPKTIYRNSIDDSACADNYPSRDDAIRGRQSGIFAKITPMRHRWGGRIARAIKNLIFLAPTRLKTEIDGATQATHSFGDSEFKKIWGIQLDRQEALNIKTQSVDESWYSLSPQTSVS